MEGRDDESRLTDDNVIVPWDVLPALCLIAALRTRGWLRAALVGWAAELIAAPTYGDWRTWAYVTAPSLLVTMTAAWMLVRRCVKQDPLTALWARFGILLVAVAVAVLVGPHPRGDLFDWFVVARETIWIGITIGMVAAIMWDNFYVEIHGRGFANIRISVRLDWRNAMPYILFAVIAFAHAAIGGAGLEHWDWFHGRTGYRWTLGICCAGWIVNSLKWPLFRFSEARPWFDWWRGWISLRVGY